MQLQANFRSKVPAKGRADDASTKVVVSCLGIAEHHGKVLGYIVQYDDQRVCCCKVLYVTQDLILQRLIVV